MQLPQDDPEFLIALHAPICPELLRDDAVVVYRDGWHKTITPSSPWAADNEILFSNLGERASDDEIDAAIAEYQALGRPMRWCVYPWTQPVTLGERLIRRGATHYDVRALVCSTDLPLQIVAGTAVERVRPDDPKAFEEYIEVMSAGWALPADEQAFRRRRYRELIAGPAPILHLFLARYQGIAAGCGAFVIKGDSAYMTGDYIKRPYQARGLYLSLHAARLSALREMGIKLASGHAREDTAAPWLLRFGHRSKFTYRIYKIEAPAA